TPLPPPTPLTPAMPVPPGMVVDGAVTGGPFVGDLPALGSALPGAPCPTCCPTDPGWAPLPGGAFVPGRGPCGYILYGSVEYLQWWIRSASLPPLLTASPAGAAGTLAPGTVVLFGGDEVAPQGRAGARFTVGWWMNECQNFGVVGSYFFLARRGDDFSAAGDGVSVLSRPFLNINPVVGGSLMTPIADREIIARPGESTGMFTASTSNALWGADINARMNLWNGCRARLDGLVGFRYLRFDEELHLNESFAATAGPNAGRMGMLSDNFLVTNDFYGGQLGLMGELKRGRWSLDLISKVALGTSHQMVNATGAQMGVNEFGQMVTGAGLLVQPSNAGAHTRDVFSVVPEVTLNLGYQVTDHLKLFVGYNYLYWSNVLRAGDQIDTTLDVNSRVFPITQSPGAVRPAVRFQDTNFWAQGINFGLQFTW
ncbi:MAG TPA: BBP7 family outer membrane beta-barrel protein, partial [Gemmataceae bacterium]